jgi:GNAT superfamily N-acetyltransferase
MIPRNRRREEWKSLTVNGVTIRTATVEDLPALREIFRRASWSNEDDRPLLNLHPEFLELSDVAVKESRTRVAVDGQPVGFASILRKGNAVELEDLFVDPDWMRRGIGRALVADVVTGARQHAVITVEVEANKHALDFYEAVGFLPVREVTLEHGVAIHMTLAIPPSLT